MRRILPLLIIPLLIGPALAEEPAKTDGHPARMTWEQHFTQADLAHDGHLTLEEAKGGFPLVAKHFDDIDVDHKGYVTTNDIRAWRVMRKAARRLGTPAGGQAEAATCLSAPAPGSASGFVEMDGCVAD